MYNINKRERVSILKYTIYLFSISKDILKDKRYKFKKTGYIKCKITIFKNKYRKYKS